MISLAERLLSLLFPRKCPVCDALCASGGNAHLCAGCEAAFRAELARTCPVCGSRAPECRCIPDTLQSAGIRQITAGFYDPKDHAAVTSRLVFALKRSQDDAAARIFSMLLAPELVRSFAARGENIREWTFVYPPRSASSMERYGFDQAERLARLCARATGARFASLFARRGGGVQKELTAAQRKENAASSFRLRRTARCAGGKFILVDDILTSGATMAACARLLREHGAADVIAAAPLKTIPRTATRRRTEPVPWFAEN